MFGIDLHYLVDSSREAYTNTPKGEFNIQRLLQGRPCWKKPNGGKQVRVKKTLVLSPECFHLDWEKRLKFIAGECIRELQADGFAVYVATGNEFRRFIMLDLFNPPLSTDAASNLLEKAARSLELDPQALLFLTPTHLQQLIEYDDEYWQSMSPAECLVNDSNISMPSLNRFFEKNGDQIVSLDLRGCLNLTPGALGKHVPSALQFLAMGMSGQPHRFCDGNTLIMNKSETLTHLSPQDAIGLVCASAKTLRCLALQDIGIDSVVLGDVLQSMPKLEVLDLAYTKKRLDNFGSAIALPKLTKLNLHNANISALAIQQLLEKTGQLVNLNLTGCRELPDNLSDCCDFSHLEKLYIGSTDISAHQFSKIIAQSKRLQLLNLFGCSNLSGDFSRQFKLPFLQELDLGLSKASSQLITTLLAPGNTSRLKSLLIDKCPPLELSRLSTFPELRGLRLDSAKIESAMLDQVLNSAKRLEQLNLSQATLLQSDWGQSCNWSSLRYLNLGYSNVDNEKTSEILTKTVRLEQLNLSKCALLMMKGVSGWKLSCLKELALEETDIPLPFLKQILVMAPKLEKLNIASSTIDGNPNTANIVAQLKRAYPQLSVENAPLRKYWPAPMGTLPPSNVVDAVTTFNPEKSFSVETVFSEINDGTHPHPRLYRCRTYNNIVLNPDSCSADNAFTMNNQGTMDLCEVTILRTSNPAAILRDAPLVSGSKRYIANLKFKVDENWQPLPSLSPYDVIEACNWDTDIQIQYSRRDNLYYVRSLQQRPRTVNLEYILRVALSQRLSNLPKKVRELKQKCLSFASNSLKMEKSNPTGQDFMAALKDQKTGSCLHRTAVFLHHMQTALRRKNVRAVFNSCHAFIEIKIRGHWYPIDLGGYPAHLHIQKPIPPQCATSAAAPTVALAKPAEGSHRPASKGYFSPAGINFTATNPIQFMHTILQDEGNILITAKRTQDIASFRPQFLRYCPQPVFYVHNPEDLICSAACIQIQDNGTGAIRPAPGGPLYDYLRNGGKLLFINYANFTPSEIIRFNSLLEDAGRVDGIPLPQDCKIIACKTPDGYDGPDFLARFDQILPLPPAFASPAANAQLYQPVPADAAVNVLEMYGGNTWQEILLGSWRLQGNRLVFQQGGLLDAIYKKQSCITLRNAPWDNDDFVSFWQCARRDGGFSLHGRYITLSVPITVYRTDGYDFRNKADLIKLPEISANKPAPQPPHHLPAAQSDNLAGSGDAGKRAPYQAAQSGKRPRAPEPVPTARAAKRMRPSNEEMHILNGETLCRFLGQYHCDSSGHLSFDNGLIAAHALKSLSVCVDDSLSAASWARLLDRCEQYEVQLILSRTGRARFPQALLKAMPSLASLAPRVEPKLQSWPGAWPANKTAYCQSSDPDTTLALLGLQDACIINISEMRPDDLLSGIDAQFDPINLKFSFAKRQGILTRELQSGRKVVLTGDISESLQQHLSVFIMQRIQRNSVDGELLLLGTKLNPFPMLQSYPHQVMLQDKCHALGERAFQLLARSFINPKKALNDYPLVKLKAMCRYLQRNPNAANPLDAWQGMLSLPPPVVDNTPLPSLQALHQRAENFDNQRLQQVLSVLKTDPFVFITGLTGVGKTSFIQQVWKQRINAELFIGQDKIRAWARSGKGDRVLFIDEANLSECPLSAFEGLFANPPHIVIGNQRYPLGRGHKVIFAGNPLSYGGERQQSSFFRRHGNSVVFQPMTPAYIAQKMLLPVLEKQFPFHQIPGILKPLLDVTVCLTAMSESQILITPREITMMALLTASYCRQQNPQADPGHVAAYYAHQLALPFIPEDKKHDFLKHFPPKEIPRPAYKNMGKILINSSNRFACHTICDYLGLRQWRRLASAHNVPVWQYGGLRGLILEGEPGIGKSELAVELLHKQGLQENRDYIFLPASMSLTEKSKRLIAAFHAGLVVVIDEINSCPMMEELYNQLLSGFDPDGKAAENPGFMVIGTQNPVHMGGRGKAPLSLQHRMQTIKLPVCHRREMEAILISKGLPARQACEMVNEYLAIKQERKLTFRDLLKRAQAEIRMINAGNTVVHERHLPAHSIFAGGNRAPTLPPIRSILSDIPGFSTPPGS